MTKLGKNFLFIYKIYIPKIIAYTLDGMFFFCHTFLMFCKFIEFIYIKAEKALRA